MTDASAAGSAGPHTNREATGETSPSRERLGQRLSAPALAFDLAGEAESLRAEEAWQRFDRNARTLVKQGDFRVVLTALKPGARLDAHRAEAHVLVETLQGHLRVHLPDQGDTLDLAAGRLLALEPGVVHQVEAVQESAFLLTVAGFRGGHVENQ